MSLPQVPQQLRNFNGSWFTICFNFLVNLVASLTSATSATVQRLGVDIPLATIQGKTSGVPFAIGAALPTNARLLACELDLIQRITGGALSAVGATVQGGTDAAGTLIGGGIEPLDVFGGSLGFYSSGYMTTPGSNPYASRGGQQIFMTLTATSDTLAHATAGHLSVNVYYAIVP